MDIKVDTFNTFLRSQQSKTNATIDIVDDQQIWLT